MLDIVDEQGNPTGSVVERGRAHAEGILHRTSHVWLVRQKDDCTQILLQKRCDTKDSFPGCYDISSAGHIPAGVGYEASAVRELSEELGVTAQESELISCGERYVQWDAEFFGKPFHDRQVSRVFVLHCPWDEEQFRLQPEEVSEVRWMELEAAMAAVRDHTIPHCISLQELQMVQRALQG